jgi:hypothetical protein
LRCFSYRAVHQENGSLSTFLLVLKGTEEFDIDRYSKPLKALHLVFGDEFWNHVVIVFTFYELGAAHMRDRKWKCRMVNRKRRDRWNYCENRDFEADQTKKVSSEIQEIKIFLK